MATDQLQQISGNRVPCVAMVCQNLRKYFGGNVSGDGSALFIIIPFLAARRPYEARDSLSGECFIRVLLS